MVLMHGTCACCAEKIINGSGLKERSCLTSNIEIADYYAEVAREDCDCEGEVILSVIVDESELMADTNSFDEPLTIFRNNYAISDSDWSEMIESEEIPYPESSDYITSLEYVESVVHKGAISSSQISIHSGEI